MSDETPGPAPVHILVVEDDPDLRELIVFLLTEEGYVVESAENGAQGFAAASAHPPDLILLDMMMPGMTGRQLYDMLQDDPVTAGVPVVFETAITRTSDKVEALRAGPTVMDYLTKPYNLDELLARVAVALRHEHTHPSEHEGEEETST